MIPLMRNCENHTKKIETSSMRSLFTHSHVGHGEDNIICEAGATEQPQGLGREVVTC